MVDNMIGDITLFITFSDISRVRKNNLKRS